MPIRRGADGDMLLLVLVVAQPDVGLMGKMGWTEARRVDAPAPTTDHCGWRSL